MTRIIGLSGKKGSGKSSTVRFLTANAQALWGVGSPVRTKVLPFAAGIKQICTDILGLRHSQVYGSEEDKNTPTPYRWEDLPHYNRLCESWRNEFWNAREQNEDAHWDDYYKRGVMTARQMMQQVGTMFRMMNVDVWPAACLRAIRNWGGEVAFIDDVRFPNEVEHIHNEGGIVLRLTRDTSDGKDRHESEVALDGYDNFDLVVDNRKMTLDEQNREVVRALYHEGVISNMVKLCECCDGIDLDTLYYPDSEMMNAAA